MAKKKRARPTKKNPHLRWLKTMQRAPLWASVARKAVWQHNDLDWALQCFGPYICAERIIKQNKMECRRSGKKYNREFAITEAATMVGMDRTTLDNYMARAHRGRG
jgi:hypothetical protein